MDPLGLNDLALAAIATTFLAVVGGAVLFFSRHLRVLAQARRSASTDPLTGLGNRTKLLEDLEDDLALARPHSPVVVALLDLDGFKRYNDAYGHPAGDALLSRLGRALGAAVCPWGSAYRLGGDEFCVVVRDRSPGLETIVSTAASALSESGDGFFIRPSCGMVALPQEAGTPDAALELAERRLYAEKNGRRESRANQDAREVLHQALREREPLLGERLEGMAELARVTGRRLELPTDELDVLVRAAELHDLGKVAVPDAILAKAGPLTDAELEFFRQHTIVADRLLSASSAMAPVARLVRSAHERFDGTGYPDGLAGAEIPLGARIVAVCAAYHSMTSERPYRAPLSRAEACAELRDSAGTQFDPHVVEAFCAAVEPEIQASAAQSAAPAPRRRRNPLLASAALFAIALIAPASALAGTASVGGNQLTTNAPGGETNNLTLSLDGANVRVAETGAGATLTPGAGCTSGGTNQALCPLSGFTSISANAGDGADRVTVSVSLPATLVGGNGDDVLTGGPLNDTLDGGAGDDWFIGNGGADTMIGGPDNDHASWTGRANPVTADLDGVADDGELGEGDNARSDIETLVGGNAADTLTGNSGNNGLDGGPGPDTLNGGAGDDYALYWSRTAPVNVSLDGVVNDGEAGENDVLAADVESAIGGSGNDTLVGNGGVNNLWGWNGDDTLNGGAGPDMMWGGSGLDRVSYASRAAPVAVSLDNFPNDGEAGEFDNAYDVENVTGGDGDDSLTGSAVANVLTGGPGKDTLIGHDGDDSFESRDQQEDYATCGNGADSIVGDWFDAVAVDCESTDRGPEPDGGGDPPPPPDPEPNPDPEPEPDDKARTASPVLRSANLRVDEEGNVTLRLRCPQSVLNGCRGRITLQFLRRAGVRASLSARRRSRNVLARGRFRIEPGEAGRVQVKLSRNGRRRVLRQRKVRCSMNVTTVGEDGKRTVTTTKVTLRASKQALKGAGQ